MWAAKLTFVDSWLAPWWTTKSRLALSMTAIGPRYDEAAQAPRSSATPSRRSKDSYLSFARGLFQKERYSGATVGSN
jgi:hypothetical protein